MIPWPYASEVTGLTVFGTKRSFVINSNYDICTNYSSGTMALQLNMGTKKIVKCGGNGLFISDYAVGGLTFVGAIDIEWSKLIFHDGVRPWGNPFGAEQFRGILFLVTIDSERICFYWCNFCFIFHKAMPENTPNFDTGRYYGYFTSMKSDLIAKEILIILALC